MNRVTRADVVQTALPGFFPVQSFVWNLGNIACIGFSCAMFPMSIKTALHRIFTLQCCLEPFTWGLSDNIGIA